MIMLKEVRNINCLEGINTPAKHDSIDSVGKVEFLIQKKWEGVVTEVSEDIVHSRIHDLENSEFEEFFFSKNDVPSDDIELIEEGALFNFYIGYRIKNKTRKNAELIKFRRKLIERHSIDHILDLMNDLDFDNLVEKY